MSYQPIVLTKRDSAPKNGKYLTLPLSANERTKLRGLRKTSCGLDVLLQLPRIGPLIPGEILTGEKEYPKIKVKAAMENLIKVQADSPLELIKAAYHLGNRHVDLELHEDFLFFLNDPVLEKMLLKRGLGVYTVKKSFYPEQGAYSETYHHH